MSPTTMAAPIMRPVTNTIAVKTSPGRIPAGKVSAASAILVYYRFDMYAISLIAHILSKVVKSS